MNNNPFINIKETADNCTIEDCEFHGDRPTVKTSATNTRLIRVKHFGQKIKEHQVIIFIIGIIAAVITGVILLMIEYGFFV